MIAGLEILNKFTGELSLLQTKFLRICLYAHTSIIWPCTLTVHCSKNKTDSSQNTEFVTAGAEATAIVYKPTV